MRKITNEEAAYLGLGDVVAVATKALGVKECPGCKKRRAKLNRVAPRVVRKRRKR